MAKIVPFKGLLYNPEKIDDLKDVVAPPYDVISNKEQQKLHDRHPNNIIRLILGKKTEHDSKEDNPHTRAAGYFNNWISEEILIQDKTPAFYLTTVEFSLEGETITRYGLIAIVGLEPFEKGVVLPHEKTFSKVKSERFELIKKSCANFSPIFSLYNDDGSVLSSLIDAAKNKQPQMDIVDDHGERHKLWRITDKTVHDRVTGAMEGKKIFIADGHHRYETALNYREWMLENNPDFGSDHPVNYVMMYLCSMQDPGLVVLPAHRMLNGVDEYLYGEFIAKAKEYFEVIKIDVDKENHEKAMSELMSLLEMNTSKNIIGFCAKNLRELYALTLKPGVMDRLFGHELSDSLMHLDVTVLTRLIFMEILGFDQARLDNEKLISYSSREDDVVEAVKSGDCDVAFILNPTKIEQVRNVAEHGEIMPRKTTYFYPKAITGQVLNKL